MLTYRLADGSVLSLLAIPPCSFSFCPAHATIEVTFRVNGMLSFEAYQTPKQSNGHRLPTDAYQIIEDLIVKEDSAKVTVSCKSEESTNEVISPWDLPSPMWLGLVFTPLLSRVT
jgi:hypothetical protein